MYYQKHLKIVFMIIENKLTRCKIEVCDYSTTSFLATTYILYPPKRNTLGKV